VGAEIVAEATYNVQVGAMNSAEGHQTWTL